MLIELRCLRETLGKIHSAFDATQSRVQALELSHTRMKAQLDIRIRIQKPMAMPHATCRGEKNKKNKAPSTSRGTDPDTS